VAVNIELLALLHRELRRPERKSPAQAQPHVAGCRFVLLLVQMRLPNPPFRWMTKGIIVGWMLHLWCRDSSTCYRQIIAGVIVTLGFLSTNGAAQPSTNSQELLQKFLQAHIRQMDPNIDQTTKFSYAFVDLNSDGKDEAIVYLMGRAWCGTGGCNTYILTPVGGSYKFVARVPASRPPIRVLDEMSHGWRVVTTVVRVDATHIYEGELRFDGQKYPLGERPPAGGLPGRLVIGENQQQMALFP
jgi:hypothetical protein